jgi:hypothetical protein
MERPKERDSTRIILRVWTLNPDEDMPVIFTVRVPKVYDTRVPGALEEFKIKVKVTMRNGPALNGNLTVHTREKSDDPDEELMVEGAAQSSRLNELHVQEGEAGLSAIGLARVRRLSRLDWGVIASGLLVLVLLVFAAYSNPAR